MKVRSRPHPSSWSVLALGVLLAGCATQNPARSPLVGAGRGVGTPGQYRNAAPVASIDSVTASCRHNPSACLAEAGINVASAAAVVKMALDEEARTSIEAELAKCADMARSEVLLRHSNAFKRLMPDADECREMTVDARGRKVSWAIRLGDEMHQVARDCVEERLRNLRPGHYSLEQRYRYDRQAGSKKLVSAEEERLLEKTGNAGELKGSLKPDVVIHSGNPLDAQAVYDFKYPCVNTDEAPGWNDYPVGHPYHGLNRGEMYLEAFGVEPARVVPRLGVVR